MISTALGKLYHSHGISLSGIISSGHLKPCQSAATRGDQTGAFTGEVQSEGKLVDMSRTK